MSVVKVCMESLVKTKVFRPGHLPKGKRAPNAIPPDDTNIKLCSVQRVSRCRNRIQNGDLPDTIGPVTMHENGCSHLRSSHMENRAVTRASPNETTPIYTRVGRTHYLPFAASCGKKYCTIIPRPRHYRYRSPVFLWR